MPGNRLVLACVFALFVSFPFAVLNVLTGAMMADIVQYDTITTGVNQTKKVYLEQLEVLL